MFAAWCWLPHAFSYLREIFRDVVWLNLDIQVHTKNVQAAHSVKWHSFPWGRVPDCALLPPPLTEEGNFSLRNHSYVTESGQLCGTVNVFFPPLDGVKLFFKSLPHGLYMGGSLPVKTQVLLNSCEWFKQQSSLWVKRKLIPPEWF